MNIKNTQAAGFLLQFPNVPDMIRCAHSAYENKCRAEDMQEVILPFIEGASLRELQYVMEAVLERQTTITGLAPRLEDAICELREQIKMEEA